MTALLLALALLTTTPALDEFTSVSGFIELDGEATPDGFGILLVLSDDTTANTTLATEVLSCIDSLPECAEVSLWKIDMGSEGWGEIASLCGCFGGFPTAVSLVGHCGFLELDPELLLYEIIDSWYTWGNPDSKITGICNLCTRCNP